MVLLLGVFETQKIAGSMWNCPAHICQIQSHWGEGAGYTSNSGFVQRVKFKIFKLQFFSVRRAENHLAGFYASSKQKSSRDSLKMSFSAPFHGLLNKGLNLGVRMDGIFFYFICSEGIFAN